MAKEKLTRFEDTKTLYNDLRARMTQLKGDKGDQGIPGPKGDSPVRGVDYWTIADIKAINDHSDAYIDSVMGPILTKLDNINGEVF